MCGCPESMDAAYHCHLILIFPRPAGMPFGLFISRQLAAHALQDRGLEHLP